jgi:hypothetical protein
MLFLHLWMAAVKLSCTCSHKKYYDITGMLCLCLSHSTNNDRDEASFVILHQFWTLIQKCFSQSDNAKIIWEKHTKRPWKTYSVTRWFSKYEVFEFLSALLSRLQAVTFKLTASKVSPMSVSKLLRLLSHDIKSWYLKIELAAFVKVQFPFRNFCYAMEGDSNLAFMAVKLFRTYPNGNLPETPSANQLIKKAVEFLQGTICERTENPIRQYRIAVEVAAAVPRPR